MSSCTIGDDPHVFSPGLADWQSVLAEGVRSAGELCRMLGLEASVAAEAELASGGFSLLAPRPFIARMRHGDASDPLLLQVLPRAAETVASPGFNTDPLGEADALWGPGLLRKYQGRILILSSGACAVHCRYCFRRHTPHSGGGVGGQCSGAGCQGLGSSSQDTPQMDGALAAIAQDRSIREVVLSGGDPLALPDEILAGLSEKLSEIPHLRRLRVHTRFPVMIPQRVTRELIGWLRESRATPIVVVQVNHPAEIDADVAAGFGRLIDAGIPLLSQSVLLRGLNDTGEVLAQLFERLVDCRVMPYYLHQLDAVAGAAHFEVPIATGLKLMAELRARLPGYAVPRYVRETVKGTSKEVLA